MGQRKGLGCLRKVFRDQGSIQSGLLNMSKIGILRGKVKLRMAFTSSKKTRHSSKESLPLRVEVGSIHT